MKIPGRIPPSFGTPAPTPQAPSTQGPPASRPSPASPKETPGVVWSSAGTSYQPAYSSTAAPAAQAKNPADPHRVPLVDPTPTLTRRLVGAKHPMGVRQVIGEAGSHLVKLRLTAALDPDGEEGQRARTQVRRLETLLRRAHYKIKGLEGEERLRQREQRAQQEKREARARELQEARRKQQLLRQAREQRYLLELLQEELPDKGNPQKRPRQPAMDGADIPALPALEGFSPGVRDMVNPPALPGRAASPAAPDSTPHLPAAREL